MEDMPTSGERPDGDESSIFGPQPPEPFNPVTDALRRLAETMRGELEGNLEEAGQQIIHATSDPGIDSEAAVRKDELAAELHRQARNFTDGDLTDKAEATRFFDSLIDFAEAVSRGEQPPDPESRHRVLTEPLSGDEVRGALAHILGLTRGPVSALVREHHNLPPPVGERPESSIEADEDNVVAVIADAWIRTSHSADAEGSLLNLQKLIGTKRDFEMLMDAILGGPYIVGGPQEERRQVVGMVLAKLPLLFQDALHVQRREREQFRRGMEDNL